MEDRIYLQIDTTGGPVYNDYVRVVQLPVEDGYMGIMSNHAPLLCAVVEGVVRGTRADGSSHYIAVTHGLAHVADNAVTVLVDAAERAEDIDLARARASERRARERLRKSDAPDLDMARAELSLRRALARQTAVRLMKK